MTKRLAGQVALVTGASAGIGAATARALAREGASLVVAAEQGPVAVRTRPPASAEENNGVVGEFSWNGAASTLFWVDPANRLAAVLFVQLVPFDRVRLHKSFRDAVYGAIAP